MKNPPRVFVSYTHDSAEHKDQVLLFSQFLVAQKIDIILDQWFLENRQDWYTWAIGNIASADFVLTIASDRYKRAAEGAVTREDNRGLQAEAALLRENLEENRPLWMTKILPVVLPGHRVEEIPIFLQPRTADHYVVTEFTVAGAESLLRVLTGQPPHVRPELGRTPDLPPHQPVPAPSGHNVQNINSSGGTINAVQGGTQNFYGR
ncbi:SEFIR domain-containing protein [Amycolatopsis pithecellobii]|nr:SEFIR domain-containing protein [Amycolatopsis pithecellobii]